MKHLVVLLVIFSLTNFSFAQSVSEIELDSDQPESVAKETDEALLAEPEVVTETAVPSSPSEPNDGMSIIIKPKQKVSEPKKVSAKTKAKPKGVKATAKKKAETKSEAKSQTASAPKDRPDSETSLRYLVNGNSRFAKKNFRADGRLPEDRERGVSGESPHTAILAESDSRIVPEIIFDQGLGEIYTVRTLGQSLDHSVIASLEYAVQKLHVPLLVVMGNSDSAAIKMLSTNEDDLSPAAKSSVDAIKPRLRTLKIEEPSPSYEVEATLNADAVARELARRSPVIRDAVERGQLTIKSALYRISTGRVTFY